MRSPRWKSMMYGLELHISDGSWLDLICGTNLRRTIIAIALPSIEAWQGQSFMGSYLIVFLESTGVQNQYLLSLLIQATLFIVVTLLFWGPDKLGRRPLYGKLGTGNLFLFSNRSSSVRRQVPCAWCAFLLGILRLIDENGGLPLSDMYDLYTLR